MLAAPSLAGQRLGVIGLARTGLAVLGFLARSGAAAIGWDDSPAARAAARAAFPDLALVAPDAIEPAALDAVVLSPGIAPQRDPLATAARAAGIPVIGDMDLFQLARDRLPAHRVVGVTGTNGKSTTTALIHHLLAAGGVTARLGGNIGLPILDQPQLPPGGVYVLELSSYQLEIAQALACDLGVWTNLSPDHLDRHGSMAAYCAAKQRLFALQPAGAAAIVATDDPWSRRVADAMRPDLLLTRVSAADVLPAMQARWPALAGPHNAQNAACAIAAARLLDVGETAIEQGLESFPGLPHRMERVAEVGGVLFVNDSKATNPESTAPALQAFARIHWLLGGQAKGAGLAACLPHLGAVGTAHAYGEAGPMFAGILAGRVPVRCHQRLEEAVQAAAAAALPGDTVLLSPAAASFDQFRDFEDRGRAFRAAVAALAAAGEGCR